MSPIRAVSFDLWDTLVVDDSDEPIRAERGLPSKRQARRNLLWEALSRQASIGREDVALAYDVADAAFNRVWHDHHVTWPIRDRLEVAIKGLGRELPGPEWEALVDAHETMEVDIPPRLVPGCVAALDVLSKSYKLAVISDAVVTPGRCLRTLLENHGILHYFGGFAFSDEVGQSKPHRAMFATAAKQLGVELTEMVHIGDRDHNDVQGAHEHGLRAVLFTAARDADKGCSHPDAHCEDYAELPGIIDLLARTSA